MALTLASLVINDVAIIRRASDGYVNGTQECQAGNKLFGNWFRAKKTEVFLGVLSQSIQKRIDEIVLYEDHGPSNRQTWLHPQAAINLAQWISPEIDVKVSRWIYELGSTGKVELGHEKPQVEIDQAWMTRIRELEGQVSRIPELEGQVDRLETELKEERKQLTRVQKNHNALTKRRQYHKLKKGSCLYIWHCLATPNRCKIGETDDGDARLAQERTTVPDLHLDLLVYTRKAKIAETVLLEHFEPNLVEPNHEHVNLEGLSREIVLKEARKTLKYIKAEWTEDTELWRYNNEEPPTEVEIDAPQEDVKTAPTTVVNITQIVLAPPSKSLEMRTCPDCGKVFSSKGNRELHQQAPGRCERARTAQPRPLEHFCPSCDAGYTTREGLRYHLNHNPACAIAKELGLPRVQTREPEPDEEAKPNYTCEFCGNGYSNRANLRTHLTKSTAPCVERENQRVLALTQGGLN